MTAGLGIWLEAASDYSMPPDCYAAVRQDLAKGLAPPTFCVPHKVSCLGCVGSGGGPAIVDIFQRVGSVTLGSLEPGAQVEATLDWPGHSEVRLRIVVVPEGDVTEVPVLPQVVTSLPEVPLDRRQEQALEQSPEKLAELELASENESEERESEERDNAVHLTSIPVDATAVQQTPTAKKEEGIFYRTVSLNNCNQIIPYLHLGGFQAAEDTQRLVDQGIRAVCCCMRELEYPSSDFCKDLSYFRVDVEDMGVEPIELYFSEATAFIHNWVSREQSLLVHCRAGVSRSASMVLAYLIAHRNYTLHDAFFLVKTHRNVITPNLGFMEKLIEYEEAVQGHPPTIDMFKYECWYTSSERVAMPELKPDR